MWWCDGVILQPAEDSYEGHNITMCNAVAHVLLGAAVCGILTCVPMQHAHHGHDCPEYLNPFRAPEPLPTLNPSNYVPKNGFPVVKKGVYAFATESPCLGTTLLEDSIGGVLGL